MTTKVNTNNFNWKDNLLYLGKRKTGFGVVESEQRWSGDKGLYLQFFKEDYSPTPMFKVLYPDGAVSKDYYNLTRAKDLSKSEARKELEVEGNAV